jgi:hypothetical protein
MLELPEAVADRAGTNLGNVESLPPNAQVVFVIHPIHEKIRARQPNAIKDASVNQAPRRHHGVYKEDR